MKFILDDIEIEHIDNSSPTSVKIGKVGFSFGHLTLEVNMDSILQASEALKEGKKPKCLKFGSLFKGCRFNFRKQETIFYTGSMNWWWFPFNFRWEPLYCFKISAVKEIVEYFSRLHNNQKRPTPNNGSAD
ncbi:MULTISPECIES: hypothetical protein [unclassified Pseudoalteromonas]|uniref:hypothetical protein n=1 Tax=unclassified Pseudoalteromonas TaxID=194690 RepID=UPI000CF67C0A|nr:MULTISPECIES: hypothetical protein [unclassified Pseudoalteromonas]